MDGAIAILDSLSMRAIAKKVVARNLYILAATLLLFALISCGMTFVGDASSPGLPGNGSLWKTTALFLTLGRSDRRLSAA